MNKARRVWVLLAVALMAFLGIAWLGFRSGSGSELRNYKAKLIADGEKLTLSELAAVRTTNGADCMRVLTNAMLALKNAPFTPGNPGVRSFVGPGRAEVSWKSPHPIWSNGMRGPGWDEFLTNVAEAEPTLRELRAALKTPAADAGPPTGILGGRRVNFVAIRQAAQWLACVTICELHEGHLEEALLNLDALCQLAQVNRSEYSLVAQMIRVAVSELGMAVTWEALQASGWTEPQLARLQRDWEKLDLLEAAETGFVCERAMGLEAYDLVRSPKARQIRSLLKPPASGLPLKDRAESWFQDYIFIPVYKVTSIDSDELFYLSSVQDAIRALRLLKAGRTWREVKHISDGALSQINAIGNKKPVLRHWLNLMLIPNYARATLTAVRNETERRMTLTAIALERFKLRNGSYPDQLERLRPEFLPEIPMDPMSSKPLVYRLKDDRTFLLYSVGEDGVNDGGDPGWTSGGKSSIWDGRDAVWPAPAETK